MNKKTIFVILDNLRVGGVQRFALDEAYSFAKRGISSRIYLLEKYIEEDDMRNIDLEYFEKFDGTIEIISVKLKNVNVINLLRRDINAIGPSLILSHSSKGVLLSRIAQLICQRKRRKLQIIGFIHQLITLSDTRQKMKRLFFFSFAHKIHASSRQFELEINRLREKKVFWRILAFKKIYFDRMGIDLDRIAFFQSKSSTLFKLEKQTLIFLSRVVGWKGFMNFLEVCKSTNTQSQKVVLTTPIYQTSPELTVFQSLKESNVLLNKGIAHFVLGAKSVHIYPTSFPQSIGLNVLECLALGIPSLISHEEFWSWPELRNSVLISSTDWEINSAIKKINQLSEISEEVRESERIKLISAISIERHITQLISLS